MLWFGVLSDPQIIDLAEGHALDLATLAETKALELRATRVEPATLAAALGPLRDARGLKALRLISSVRSLPAALTELRGLQALELVDPVLPGLPSSIAELSRLRSLRLELPHLASLPRSIAGLTRLRELHVDSHHLCGLPEGVSALVELRTLTLILRHEYVHDWQRPAHFNPRFDQPLEALFALLATLPNLTSLTLAEPWDSTSSRPIFDRLPAEFAGLRALETLTILDKSKPIGLPPGVCMPWVREVDVRSFDATQAEVRAMFPNAPLRVR